MLFGPS